MKISQIIESRDMCNVCGQTPCNCTHISESQLNEFAPAANPGGGNYLKALASAWYNGTFNTGDLHKGIKSQEDVEKILARGIHCGDGKVRKYEIGYNSDFDGVLITSDDYYNYSDYDDAGNEVDERTGKPWGPYEYVEFDGNELDEGLMEFAPGNGDDREPNEEEILRKLAALWWNGTEQQMARAQQTLEAMGWEIGPDESGDDDAGVYVYRIGDDDGKYTLAFGHSDLSLDQDQLDEKWSQKYKNSINCSNPKGFSQRAHCQGKRK